MLKRKPNTLESILAPFNKMVGDLETFISDQTLVALAKRAKANSLKKEAADHLIKVGDAKQSLVAIKCMILKGDK